MTKGVIAWISWKTQYVGKCNLYAAFYLNWALSIAFSSWVKISLFLFYLSFFQQSSTQFLFTALNPFTKWTYTVSQWVDLTLNGVNTEHDIFLNDIILIYLYTDS